MPVFPILPLSEDATPRTILSWGSILLHGLYPKNPVLKYLSAIRTTLMGFLSPSTHTGKESPRPTRLTGRLPDSTRGPGRRPLAGPTLPATVPLSGFLSLSATLLLSIPPCHFQTGGAHGVRPSGIYSSYEASNDSSPPDYPLVVTPASCAAPAS